MISRKDEALQYEERYAEIPRDYNQRINYILEKNHVTPKQMNNIISKKRSMEFNMTFYDYQIVLYEIPHIKPRPRYRLINRKNFMDAALANPHFIHVYSPHAGEDHESMHRLVASELEELHLFIQTPCTVTINAYEPTPSSFNVTDTILAEYGLIFNTSQSDYDNLLKNASDRLNSNVWLDDNLVISGTVNKLYSILPREEIYIRYLNCAVNKNMYNRTISRKEYREDYPINYLDKNGNMINFLNQ